MRVRARPSIRRENHLGAFSAQHPIEVVNELAIAVVDEELDRRLEPVKRPGQVPGLLGHPGRIRVGSTAGVEHSSAMDLNEDEDVQRLQQDCVDGEEIAGEDRAGMGAQEFSPRWSWPPWGTRDPVPAQSLRHAFD